MLKYLRSIFPARTRQRIPDNLAAQEHRYPPFPQGIPCLPVDTLVESQRDLIHQIICSRGLAGSHNRPAVDQQINAAILDYAKLVHLLPATEKSYFRAPGGLFRFGLECGLFAIRYAERRILTRETPEIRKETERLWTHASFLAGLFSEAIVTIAKVSVYSEEGLTWHPGVESLAQWLTRNQVRNYHLRWLAQEDRAMAVTIAGKTIPSEQAKLLADGEKQILSTLMSALYNMDDLSNPIVNIVRSVRYKVIERDLAADSSRYGKPMAGMHLEPWLIDAMRHLLQKGRWEVNQAQSRIWYGEDGLFLVWPIAAHDIRKELQQSKCPFVPNTMDILAEIMVDAKILETNGNPGGFLFDIAVPQADHPELMPLVAVRLARAEILFGSQSAEALPMTLSAVPPSAPARSNEPLPFQSNNRQEYDTDAVEAPWASPPPLPAGALPVDQPDAGRSYNDYDEHYAADYPSSAGTTDVSSAAPIPEPIPQPGCVTNCETVALNKEPAASHPSAPTEPSSERDSTTLIGALLSTGQPEKTPLSTQSSPIASAASAQDVWVEQLLTKTSPSKAAAKKAKNKPPDTRSQDPALLAVRQDMVLERLRRLPKDSLIPLPDGLLKVYAHKLKQVGLDCDDCVSVLKAAGLLQPVAGLDFGLDDSGKKTVRYFLVRAEKHGA